jgi:hypothetical protein
LEDYCYLAAREVVPPLSAPVISTEDRSTRLAVTIADLRIQEQAALNAYQKVKLEIERTYRINEIKCTIIRAAA